MVFGQQFANLTYPVGNSVYMEPFGPMSITILRDSTPFGDNQLGSYDGSATRVVFSITCDSPDVFLETSLQSPYPIPFVRGQKQAFFYFTPIKRFTGQITCSVTNQPNTLTVTPNSWPIVSPPIQQFRTFPPTASNDTFPMGSSVEITIKLSATHKKEFGGLAVYGVSVVPSTPPSFCLGLTGITQNLLFAPAEFQKTFTISHSGTEECYNFQVEVKATAADPTLDPFEFSVTPSLWTFNFVRNRISAATMHVSSGIGPVILPLGVPSSNNFVKLQNPGPGMPSLTVVAIAPNSDMSPPAANSGAVLNSNTDIAPYVIVPPANNAALLGVRDVKYWLTNMLDSVDSTYVVPPQPSSQFQRYSPPDPSYQTGGLQVQFVKRQLYVRGYPTAVVYGQTYRVSIQGCDAPATTMSIEVGGVAFKITGASNQNVLSLPFTGKTSVSFTFTVTSMDAGHFIFVLKGALRDSYEIFTGHETAPVAVSAISIESSGAPLGTMLARIGWESSPFRIGFNVPLVNAASVTPVCRYANFFPVTVSLPARSTHAMFTVTPSQHANYLANNAATNAGSLAFASPTTTPGLYQIRSFPSPVTVLIQGLGVHSTIQRLANLANLNIFLPTARMYPRFETSAGQSNSFSGLTNSGEIYAGQSRKITVILDTPPKGNVIASLASTTAYSVSPATATLSASNLGAEFTFTPLQLGGGSISIHLDGAAGAIYPEQSMSYTALVRAATWIRYCPPHEISVRQSMGEINANANLGPSCLFNMTMNRGSVLPTYFNISLPTPPSKSITFIPKSAGLIFSPTTLTINAGFTTGTFQVAAKYAGYHHVSVGIKNEATDDVRFTNAPIDMYFESRETSAKAWSFVASSASVAAPSFAILILAFYALFL